MMKIALTPGEPAGIGPDICLQVPPWQLPADILVIADPELLRERARLLRSPVSIAEYDGGAFVRSPDVLNVVPVARGGPTTCGHPDAANATYVLRTLDVAIRGCLDGAFDALVTGPVQKSIINKAGIPFTGHTEYLAEATGRPDVVMMLATSGLRVALATTHLPLKSVISAISPQRIERTILTTWDGLHRYFGIASPRLLVCGLNPHAGEDGEMGTEEIECITPVIRGLCDKGLRIAGPRPADTAFLPEVLAKTDAVIAMYHDQGLPVLKHAGFGEAINITLGLPFIRTSVDHGTALELAGTGRAHATSLRRALQTAIEMIASYRRSKR
jgi:4-hydroxythreonine-4-phosphate dehydrogenase